MSRTKEGSVLPLIVSLIVLAFRAANSPAAVFNPVFHPSIEINKIDSPIKIDGALDDPGWIQAAKADNFIERYPGRNVKPQVETESYIAYDNDKLYIAFRCRDDPSRIRATMCQRDQFDGDDNVCFLLDTYGNASWAYEFFVNPYGIQMDRLWSNITGEDAGFDLIWESAAQITDSGYQVEMAIPFASLRFPDKDSQTWKIDFWRNHPREFARQYSWAAYNPDDQCWVCQWGTATGINGVKPGKGLELLPSIIASQSGNIDQSSNLDSPFSNNHAETSISVGGKFSVSSNMAVEATYNPDFSQIEADAAQIDVNSTIALRYPERRPFFQEGSDIFQTPFNSFYSRTINDPQFAAKFTGRSGRYNFGYISAYDENTPYIIPLEERSILVNTGKSMVNVLRASRTIGLNNFLGFIVTDRRFDGGGYGSIFSGDGVLRLSEKYSVVGQYIISLAREPVDSGSIAGLSGIEFDHNKYDAALNGEYYTGQAIVSQIRRQTRNWSFVLNYDHTSPSYRTETGYDPWNDYKNLNFYTNYDIYPSNSIIGRISPQLSTENRWDFSNVKKWTHVGGQLQTDFTIAQTYANIAFFTGTERWQDVNFSDLWTIQFQTGCQPGNKLGYNFEIDYGPQVARWLLLKGKEVVINTELMIKPMDMLIIEPTLEFSKSNQIGSGDELYKQTIGRTRFRFQFNRELSMRLVAQYIDESDPFNGRSRSWEFDPLLTYRINSFSVFYAGSTHNIARLLSESGARDGWRQTSRQFFVKLQYLFRA
jgi:hypothetical protein